MITIEVLVTSTKLKQAKKLINDLRLHEKKSDYKQLDGVFIVKLELTNELTEDAYDRIRENDALSIVSDPGSNRRAREVFDYAYRVETLLRKLLLHLPDLTSTYVQLISSRTVSRKNSQKISEKNSLDPVTSDLQFGQLLVLLTSDVSGWNKTKVTWDNILVLLNETKNFDELKTKLADKLEPLLIWELISKNVLTEEVPWEEIKDKLEYIKKARDKVAHHQIITESQRNKVKRAAEDLLMKIVPKMLNAEETQRLKAVAKELSEALKNTTANGGYPDMWAFPPRDTIVDAWGMYNRESVSYAAYRVASSGRHMPYWGGAGNANQWPTNAQAAGIPTGSIPRVGSVAISMAGTYGHAMWVEEVYDNGTIRVSQYNFSLDGKYSETVIPGEGLIYIYF